MSNIKWSFPSNDGGRETGLHDPGVETFKGNFTHYLARELIQNSFDARADSSLPVTVEFKLHNFLRSDIPDMDGLSATLDLCAEYWKGNSKPAKFFKDSATLSREKNIPALVVSDYNTQGVRGTDKERDKDWYNLIRCAGSSAKRAGSGGSFGIGKNAPFAASPLRTVFYSTLNVDGVYIFQGVSTLATFELPDGRTAQPTGYLGIEGASVRDSSAIPPNYLRRDRGTDITVIGYKGGDNWQEELLFSVLDNFWLAIYWGELIVTVGSETVDKDSLEKLLVAFGKKEGFSGYLYYQAYTKGKRSTGNLKNLNEVDVYLLDGAEDMPKKVSLMRNTGMTIERKRFNSIKPYCGVFICRNDKGSDKLRQMEPPKHDKWDPDHPDKGENKKIETEYVTFIRKCIRDLAPIDDSKVIAVPGLHHYLPDDDDSPDEPFDDAHKDTTNEGNQEAAEAKHTPQKVEGHVINTSRKYAQLDNSKLGEDDNETESSAGNQDGDEPDDESNNSSGGNAPGGGAGGEGKGNSSPTSSSSLSPKSAVSLKARTFCTDAKTGAYTFLLKSDVKSVKAKVVVYAVGDDQRDPVIIKSITTELGESVPVISGVIGPVDLTPNKPLKLHVVLAQPIRLAMEVAAYEA